MTKFVTTIIFGFSLVALAAAAGCADDADTLGVGAQCAAVSDCLDGQACLTAFKGGYCGIKDCTQNTDCPSGSQCIAHTDGVNYCFRVCTDKVECNENRDAANESNCSSNITFADGTKSGKVCVPPSN